MGYLVQYFDFIEIEQYYFKTDSLELLELTKGKFIYKLKRI